MGPPRRSRCSPPRCTQRDPDAVVFSLASDHAITEVDLFQDTMRSCYDFIERHPEHVALVGIKPTRADTGLGYIKVRERFADDTEVYSVEKFVEKPTHRVAAGYLESGDYYWNAAYYCFRAGTLLEAYDTADPRLVESARRYLAEGDPAAYRAAPRKVHEIELIDSGTYPLVVVPAEFAWSDIGNWQTLHHVMAEMGGEDLVVPNARQHADVDSTTGLVLVPPEYQGIVAHCGTRQHRGRRHRRRRARDQPRPCRPDAGAAQEGRQGPQGRVVTQEPFEVRTAIAPETLQSLVDSASPYVHVITIATKPDIIKQAPVYRRASASRRAGGAVPHRTALRRALQRRHARGVRPARPTSHCASRVRCTPRCRR